MKTILLLLGESSEYLDYKVFDSESKLEEYTNALLPLLIANIKKEQPLRKRLLLLPDPSYYFPSVGALQEFEYIELEPEEEEEEEEKEDVASNTVECDHRSGFINHIGDQEFDKFCPLCLKGTGKYEKS
jgi:hypothetical protein